MAQIKTALALTLAQTCGGGPASDPVTSTGITCSEYQLILKVELIAGAQCEDDAECDQVIEGTGVGCETDDIITSNEYDPSYFYDYLEEAEAEGCTITFETLGECDPLAEPACIRGSCAWR